ncbi:ABC transporter substrate-binding protein [Streptacidiphilus neutrinimicus]|uniref:ABC transporter substrate-binding protein n=1 Tax=Streptacidiphilus neutrinimicus TaxID=105420 RepID=UPI0005A6D00B|nr:ABC transporter substrate-binding protein [Streptacidiphilus neutrinimicus]
MNRHALRLLATAMAAGTLATATACSGSKADATKLASAPVAKQAVTLGTAADSTGPDPAVPGAKSGGTVTVLQTTDFSHMDPARVYSAPNQTVDLLLTRQLTSYQYVNGVTRLVGDLATNTGVSSDGGRTWTYTLKAGVKYQDGSPITAQDVKYGIERTFEASLSGGPNYLQTWLTGSANYSGAYPGPWNGQDLPAIEVPDARTIVFHLKSPHADFPYAAAMQAYTPVPKAHDTKQAFDTDPFSSGPYRIVSHDADKSLELARSAGWDPATDPVRHAYPDRWNFEFGGQSLDIDQRLIAANGADSTAMTFNAQVTGDVAEQVLGTPSLRARTVDQVSPFSTYFDINNRRIKDVKIRQALLMAFPRQQVRQIFGGPLYGDYSNTILSPVTNGFQAYDLYHAPVTGDPAAARKLLAQSSDPHPTIVFAYGNTGQWQQAAVAVSAALGQAGFHVVTHAVDAKDYYDEIGNVDNTFDVYVAGWGPDWPSADTVIAPLFDGRLIAPDSSDSMLFDDPSVNAQIDRITAETDLAQQDKDWAALDKKIMGEAPIIPWVDLRQVSLYGPNLGGVHLGFIGTVYPLDVFVK